MGEPLRQARASTMACRASPTPAQMCIRDSREIVAQGWDLAALEEHYLTVLKTLTGAPQAGPDGTLFGYVRMVSEWQRFPFSDPQLPEALLPEDVYKRQASMRPRSPLEIQPSASAISSRSPR